MAEARGRARRSRIRLDGLRRGLTAFFDPIFIRPPFASRPDRVVAALMIVLAIAGLVLQLASSPGAVRGHHQDPFTYFYRQLAFAGAAALAFAFGYALSPRGVRRLGLAMFTLSAALLAFLDLFGGARLGAARWLDLGPISLQPTEFLKPGFVILIALLFSERAQQGAGPRGRRKAQAWLWAAFFLLSLAGTLLLAQPDWGHVFLMLGAFFAVFFVAGMPAPWLVSGLGLGFGGLMFAAAFLFSPHARSRIIGFFHRSEPPFQVKRALEAYARGGFWGVGPGQSRGKLAIPEAHTDFPFAIIGEEYGVLIALLLLAAMAALCLRGLILAARQSDDFRRNAAFGLFFVLGAQSAINVAVGLNAAPAKGMTLPFVSYGGSSLISAALTVGLALSLSRRDDNLPPASR